MTLFPLFASIKPFPHPGSSFLSVFSSLTKLMFSKSLLRVLFWFFSPHSSMNDFSSILPTPEVSSLTLCSSLISSVCVCVHARVCMHTCILSTVDYTTQHQTPPSLPLQPTHTQLCVNQRPLSSLLPSSLIFSPRHKSWQLPLRNVFST